MNDQKKPVSGVEATAHPVLSAGRRRLVKGAMLATPAVMTLMSGRLAAATSVGCANRPESIAAPGTILSESTDDQGVLTTYAINDEYGIDVIKKYTDGTTSTQQAGLDEINVVLGQNPGVGTCLGSFA